jgi:peptidoglycan/LPS O-acetylase OafA/YrhL
MKAQEGPDAFRQLFHAEPQRLVAERAEQGTGRFVSLDGIRGFAALVVMMFHASANRVFAHGFLAVDLFFALSGFVLMHVYGKRAMSPQAFIAVRLIRLYPIYAFGLLIGLLSHLGESGAGVSFLMGALFIPHVQGNLYPLNGVSWSLVDEIVINVIFGFMLARRISIEWLLAASLAAGAVLLVFDPHQVLHINGGWTASSWLVGYLRAAFSFSLGVIIYRQAGRVPSVSGWWPIAGILILFGIPGAVHAPFISALAIAALFPLAVLVGSSPHIGGASAQLFEWLGRISYALYAVHIPVLHLSSRILGEGTSSRMAGLLAAIVTAHVLATFLDPPVRRWLASLRKPAGGQTLSQVQPDSGAAKHEQPATG